tara:strand:- start:4076 stop:4213 length:138 start_codon:yes stop_codon:yes gene_type:complete
MLGSGKEKVLLAGDNSPASHLGKRHPYQYEGTSKKASSLQTVVQV